MNVLSKTGSWLRGSLERDWLRLTLITWAILLLWFMADRWNMIRLLSLGDTDDNMRLAQVRALLGGQGWYDLRQYRLSPPAGFDIHWSRIVDLPLAALILLLRPFVGTAEAERLACGIAPLLPLSIALLGLGATVRRLVSPVAWPLAIVLLLCCATTMSMFMPDRIDHHGWQLAMLALSVAGLADPEKRRGGLIVGLSSAVSLNIGLELLPYAAMAGAIITLRWVWDRDEAARLSVYGLTLAGGSGIGFVLFASNANQALRCDALTPVWLSAMVVGGGLLFLLARLDPATRWARLILALVAAAVIGAGFALLFPQCLGRPEQVSPELAKAWLNNVREARPIYKHPFRMAFPIVALPVVGLIGAGLATWLGRRGGSITGWVPVLMFSTFAALMLLWQARAGPAAQLLAVPGIVALAWIGLPWLVRHRGIGVKLAGGVAVLAALALLFSGSLMKALSIDRPTKRVQVVNLATGRCMTVPALRPLNRLPKQVVFTFVDLGPRLITVTHHDAIAGPYHRNGDAILDVQHAFSRSPENFRATARKYGATLLLVCPNMAESTVYRARNPGGFYDQLAHNRVPAWLTPLPLPKKSPLRLFRID
ncbi:AcrB/AcrD/AcrF family protein [Sphingomonas hylomeconis]|uniref:AcrB/AcrD/AcrF family protein n=1 Tax=Sphingomonas hylomeconis TaxID=1395958 RepID=A0ABV7SRP2_9SPHN|nr:AcrB/AcrD/AcrF family protein [Sphingomonas hylomeconis]